MNIKWVDNVDILEWYNHFSFLGSMNFENRFGNLRH